MLAFELDEREANEFLPTPIRTTEREYIAARFPSPALDSLLMGVGPADVHNRDPRKLPLITGGAQILGNGVLAQAEDRHVVFCQLVPFACLGARDEPKMVVSGQDSAEGRYNALLTMGTLPWCQLGQKIQAGEVGKTYTFTASVKALVRPVTVRLEIQRAGPPWDRVGQGNDVALPLDTWTDLQVTFPVDQSYPEGWLAQIHCASPGSQIRADAFQLYEGEYVEQREGAGTADSENLLVNPGFEEGTEPWLFSWRTEQQNLRKTFRRSSVLVSRLLANMGVRASTPLLSRFSTPTSEIPEEPVTKDGDRTFARKME